MTCVLGAYFCINMILITLSSFLSVTVINIYMREDQNNKVPAWLRKVSEQSDCPSQFFFSNAI